MAPKTTMAALVTLLFSVSVALRNDDAASVHRSGLSGRRRMQSETAPNIIIVLIDDMPFLQQFATSAPVGVKLDNHTVEYDAYPTPNITAFRDSAIVFARSYCGGPKCAPSRYSVLTGRMPSRSEFAIANTLRKQNGGNGTSVTVVTDKIQGVDAQYNIARVLQDNGYYTGTVGKWHLLSAREGCNPLAGTPNLTLYNICTAKVNDQGFDVVDAFYYTNIAQEAYFSHNPEWLVSRAQAFIDEAVDVEEKPFFLYFASTLTHSSGDVYEALQYYNISHSPKGMLTGDELPDDTAMRPRDAIWSLARKIGKSETFSGKKDVAKYLWADEQFGALIDYLQRKGIYDDTMVILMADHGVGAKGTLYEQGSRIWNFLRYPALFGTDQVVLADDFLVSNVDLAATIFEMVGAAVPANYTMDGVSWLDEVEAAVNGEEYSPEAPCCEQRFIDIKYSRSIVTADYKYIFRAMADVETAGEVNTYYAYAYDLQQLYDLKADPSEQSNIIAEYESYRADDSDGALSSLITSFQSTMKDYVDEICPRGPDDGNGECLEPSYTFCTEIERATVAVADWDAARDQISCAFSTFYFAIDVESGTISMDICCADDAEDGAIFPGTYSVPDGYSSFGDVQSVEALVTMLRFAANEGAADIADDGIMAQFEDAEPVLVLSTVHKVVIVGLMALMLAIGCAAGRFSNECSKTKMMAIAAKRSPVSEKEKAPDDGHEAEQHHDDEERQKLVDDDCNNL